MARDVTQNIERLTPNIERPIQVTRVGSAFGVRGSMFCVFFLF